MDLQARATGILTRPREEWNVIEAEPTDVATLYKSYIAILAAIPAVAGFIGLVLIGVSVPFAGHVRWGVASGLRWAIFQYIGALIGVYIAALVLTKLAPSFGSRDNFIQALKLVAYSLTPMWLAGVLSIIPALGALSIIGGLYGIYLLYLGVPVLMKTPADKVIPYLLVSLVVVFVVNIVLFFIIGALAGTSGMMWGG
jgi:hypothetical protein